MIKRLQLDAKLKALLGPTVTVYFQPPSGIELSIPACIYTFEGVNNRNADGTIYVQFERYTVKIITTDLLEPFVMNLIKNRDFSFSTMYPTGHSQYVYLFRTSI